MDTVEQLTARQPAGLVWIDSSLLTLLAALEEALEPEVHVHWDRKAPPEEASSTVIYYPHDEDIAEGVRHSRHATPDAPILGFGPHADSQVARDALQVGARSFIHAQMSPEQVRYALLVAREGDVVLHWPGRQGLRFSTELSAAVDKAHALFVAVDTPQGEEDGSADPSSAAGAARAFGRLEGPPADGGQQETQGDYRCTTSIVAPRVRSHPHVDNSWCHR